MSPSIDPTKQIPLDAQLPNPSVPSMDAEKLAEVRRRLRDDDENPDASIPWEQIKREALARWRK